MSDCAPEVVLSVTQSALLPSRCTPMIRENSGRSLYGYRENVTTWFLIEKRHKFPHLCLQVRGKAPQVSASLSPGPRHSSFRCGGSSLYLLPTKQWFQQQGPPGEPQDESVVEVAILLADDGGHSSSPGP